jgi:hypothetical protein
MSDRAVFRCPPEEMFVRRELALYESLRATNVGEDPMPAHERVFAMPIEDVRALATERGLPLDLPPPPPITPLEQDLRDGKLGKLYTPKQYRRLELKRRVFRPFVRIARPRGTRSRRSPASAHRAHGPPSRLAEPDEPEPARGRLQAIVSRIIGRRP